jgi:hypothetical protein
VSGSTWVPRRTAGIACERRRDRARSTIGRALAAVAAATLMTALGTSCVGLSRRVDRGALAAVPNEELLLLFDAEHAVYIARDEVETAARALLDARTALQRARAYDDVIAARRDSGAAIDTVAVLELLEQWNDARIAMREAELDLRSVEVDGSDVRLWAARARYEREKARLVKEKNPAVGAGLDLDDFDEQARDWTEREAAVQQRIDERTAAVVAARAAYFELSRRLQEQSRGAYGGPWADLLD